ncbi:MAG: hypothetical protein P1U40_07610 [Coxiellaceae bacterium]|nr:hypothetical protein [Coxiellaceae bacterium]
MPLGSTVITKGFAAEILAMLPQLQGWIDEAKSEVSEAKDAVPADDSHSIVRLLEDLLAVLTRLGNDRNLKALKKSETELLADTARLVSAADAGLRKCILPRCAMSHRVALSLMRLLTTGEGGFEARDRSRLDVVILEAMKHDSSKTPFMQALAEYYGVKSFDKMLTRKARTFGDVKPADIYGPVCVQVAHIEQYEWFRGRLLAREQRQQWLTVSESLLDTLGERLVIFAQYKFNKTLPDEMTPEQLEADLKQYNLMGVDDNLDTVSYEDVVAAYSAQMQQLYAAHDRLVPYSIDPDGFYSLMEMAGRSAATKVEILSAIFDDVVFKPDCDTLTDFVKEAIERDQAVSRQLKAINPAFSAIAVAKTYYAQHFDAAKYAEVEAQSSSLPLRMRAVLDAYRAHAKVTRTPEDIIAVERLTAVVLELEAKPLDKAGAYKLVVTLHQLRYQHLVRVRKTPEARITDSAAIFLSLQPLVHQLVDCFTLQTDARLYAAVMSEFAPPRAVAPVGGSATFHVESKLADSAVATATGGYDSVVLAP